MESVRGTNPRRGEVEQNTGRKGMGDRTEIRVGIVSAANVCW